MSAPTLSGRTGSTEVASFARQHPGVVTVAKVGWVAKGVVYALLGVLAVPIALHGSGADDGGSGSTQASQTGAVARLAESSAGALALWLVAIGLFFYVAWRLVCVLLPAGNGAKAWITRIGYVISAIVYVSVAWTAVSFARDNSTKPAQGGAEDSKIEKFTRDLMEHSAGRWAVGIIGVAVIAVGVAFVVRGVTSDFRKELEPGGVGPISEQAITRLGQIGWIGRGLMMMIVGWFLTMAAVHFRADKAKGIDGALREATGSALGTALVFFVAVALIVYGVFCVISAPRVRLRGAD